MSASVQSLSAADKSIVEAAKREGRVVYYTTMNVDHSVPMVKNFEARYPFLKVDLYRAGGPQLLNKIFTEQRAGRHLADVILITLFEAEMLKRKGLFDKYHSPEAKAVREEFREPEGYSAAVYINPEGVAYNTKMVRPNEVPQKYEDLLHPRWKNQLSLDNSDTDWMMAVLKILGEAKGMEFMNRLAAQNPRMARGHTLQVQQMAAGEYPIVVASHVYRVEQMRLRGAPVDFVYFEPVPTNFNPIAMGAGSAHPNAAKLLIDYMLSKDGGQEHIRRVGRVPARSDMQPSSPRLVQGVKLYPFSSQWVDEYDKYQKIWDSIFLK
jgi:iron(III) transport system substrate-binding protein